MLVIIRQWQYRRHIEAQRLNALTVARLLASSVARAGWPELESPDVFKIRLMPQATQ